MKAILKTYRHSPRKVRVVADLLRGKKITEAKNSLIYAGKKAGPVLLKSLDSAIANAKNNFAVSEEGLFVKEITVNQGIVMKRSMPRARGSASPIRKKTSHIVITLGVKGEKKEARPEQESSVKVLKSKKTTKK